MKFGFGLGGRAGTQVSSVFDPATLALSGWWRAPYSGSPLVAVASAGGSGSNGNLTEATNPPSAGASLNSLASADFDGTNDVLKNANNIVTFLSETAWSVSCLFSGDTASARSVGAAYSDRSLLTNEAQGLFYLTFTTGGVTVGHYDGGFKEVTVACATGGSHLISAWYDGTNLNLSIDGGAASTAAASTAFTNFGGGVLKVGLNYDGSAKFDGRIWDLMTATTNLGSTARSNIKSYINSRYALSF